MYRSVGKKPNINTLYTYLKENIDIVFEYMSMVFLVFVHCLVYLQKRLHFTLKLMLLCIMDVWRYIIFVEWIHCFAMIDIPLSRPFDILDTEVCLFHGLGNVYALLHVTVVL